MVEITPSLTPVDIETASETTVAEATVTRDSVANYPSQPQISQPLLHGIHLRRLRSRAAAADAPLLRCPADQQLSGERSAGPGVAGVDEGRQFVGLCLLRVCWTMPPPSACSRQV